MEAVGQADQQRMHDLYVAHAETVLTYIRRRYRGSDAEDLLAETFLIGWKRLNSIPAGHELPWLYGVAHNAVRSRWRRDAAESTARQNFAYANVAPRAEVVGTSDIRDVLTDLRDDQVEILLLSAWEGLTGAALAAALGCSTAAARVRLYRARRALEVAFDPPRDLSKALPFTATSVPDPRRLKR